MESHLLQMRGLKLWKMQRIWKRKVASFTDAWIETIVAGEDDPAKCRIFYRCVD